MYSGLHVVRSQSLHGEYSSGCIESTLQPSPMKKSRRKTLTSYKVTAHVILSYPRPALGACRASMRACYTPGRGKHVLRNELINL